MLAGQFDPNIRPDQSRHVADLIEPNVRWIDFAGIGHSVRHHSPCAQGLVATFIGEPERDQDTTCANGEGAAEASAPIRP